MSLFLLELLFLLFFLVLYVILVFLVGEDFSPPFCGVLFTDSLSTGSGEDLAGENPAGNGGIHRIGPYCIFLGTYTRGLSAGHG